MFNIFLKKRRKYLLFLLDIAFIITAYLIVWYFKFSELESIGVDKKIENSIILASAVYVMVFYFLNVYKFIWMYAGAKEYAVIAIGCMGAVAITSIAGILLPKLLLSVDLHLLACVVIMVLTVGLRVFMRVFYYTVILNWNRTTVRENNLLIIGGGSAANIIIRDINMDINSKYNIIGIIDDDIRKHGSMIANIKVLGTRNDIVKICGEKNVNEILLAIPSASPKDKKEILNICSNTKCHIKILPGLLDLVRSKSLKDNLRDAHIEDLLEREPIVLDNSGILNYIENKVVMITGGGGSIGSGLCWQITKYNPKQIIILDNYENSAFEIENEIKSKMPEINVIVCIASIRDRKRVDSIFEKYRPNVIFHAAAHKHVPLMENNPGEAIKNNVFGTLNLVELADKYQAQKFVLISTDKAVNPTNIMGASKRICEMIIQSINNSSKTDFVAVRFGNVLGSNGSVIPIFKKQIAQGGPVTLTHKDITRFFMTIPEATQLVIQAGVYAKGGEIFVLDMGQPVKIYDLAVNLIKLSGLKLNEDIKIKITGLRHGEKLYEELLMAEEGLQDTDNEKIFIAKPMYYDLDVLRSSLNRIKEYIDNNADDDTIKKVVVELVPTYTPHCKSQNNLKEVDNVAVRV